MILVLFISCTIIGKKLAANSAPQINSHFICVSDFFFVSADHLAVSQYFRYGQLARSECI